jgi:thioredoxin reductase (NADPH)
VKIYDSIIIGGGPAGLSASVYLGRSLRSVLVLDAGEGRTQWNQRNDNYLGFPNGIRSSELVRRGRLQAQNFGVEFQSDCVQKIRRDNDIFEVALAESTLRSRTLIFATGVTDVWPSFPNARRYVAKSLFWCLHCDGFRVIDKRVIVLGNSDAAATTALQLLDYTPQVEFVCETEIAISPEKQAQLREAEIRLHQSRIIKVRGKGGQLAALYLENGACLELDYLFSALGQVPNSQLAAGVGVELGESGCIKVDAEMHTNIPGVFAAGDVTNLPAQQVATAVHQGALAGVNANYFLRPRHQKLKTAKDEAVKAV